MTGMELSSVVRYGFHPIVSALDNRGARDTNQGRRVAAFGVRGLAVAFQNALIS